MNRIATRALIILVLVITLFGGLVFFLGEYISKSDEWILFSGSPHVYTGSQVSAGTVTDREGLLLADLRGERSYATDPFVRMSTLHWVGDRSGNIHVPAIDHYTEQLLGYDSVGGVYSYGDTVGNISLTLSAQVQAAALKAMGDYVGTVAVYNYKTGEILCAVSTPTFDPDNVPDISGDTSGLYSGVYWNRFIQSKYIPGSIFKIVTLAAALETIPDIQEQSFACSGVYKAGTGDITCIYAHGTQNLKEAFSNSCNCAFAQITEQIGREKFTRYVEQLNVVSPLSFDGFTTASGNFDVTNTNAEAFAWSGIGQHKDQINPCGFLAFVGAIAADGVVIQPHIVSQIQIGEKITYTAELNKGERILSSTTAKLLQEYMGNNVTVKYGAENFPNITVCAKSGTGEVGGEKRPNAMFTGFIADEAYPLAFIVAIEEGGFGSQTCIPVISQVLQACIEAMNP